MKVLVANRGEIAVRILRTLREMGIASTAVHADCDRGAPHLDLADDVVALGAPDRYLSADALLGAARKSGCTAVHPGYGFLSQSAGFVRACEAAGLVFIGPSAEAMERLGDKRASRAAAEAAGVPVIPGAQRADSAAEARESAARLGYPVLLKAAGGGGGKGMRLVASPEELDEAHAAARREAAKAFADERLLVEKYIHPARHIEVQVLGDGREAVAVGERDCSLQRRYQKVIEEGPAPGLSGTLRRDLAAAAVRLARAAGYRSAGTVEFLVDESGGFHFLEVNTRLQVEHPVTEAVTGLDLVRAQIEIAQGAALPAAPAPRGHALEARLNAEDPYAGFLPQSGRVLQLDWPQLPGLRIDTGLREGLEVTPHFDPLLAKLVAWGADREQARRRLIEALRGMTLLGVTTNQAFLIQVLESPLFRTAASRTTSLESLSWPEPPVPPEILDFAGRAAAPSASARGSSPGPWERLGPFRVGS